MHGLSFIIRSSEKKQHSRCDLTSPPSPARTSTRTALMYHVSQRHCGATQASRTAKIVVKTGSGLLANEQMFYY